MTLSLDVEGLTTDFCKFLKTLITHCTCYTFESLKILKKNLLQLKLSFLYKLHVQIFMEMHFFFKLKLLSTIF